MDISHVTDQSSSMSRQPLYEVFLSFSGADMRRGFADFMYTMLTDVGISVFRIEEELERSEETFPQPIQVIEQCKISIPIISKEYASSQSCLLELEQMVECMDNKSRIIIPIFYYIDPSDVRNCSGPSERALDEHEKQNCIPPLHRIGELEGHHLHEKSEVSPGEVVRQIVCQVEQMLKKQDLVVPKQLVGVDSHVQGIMAKLKVDYRNGQAVKIGDSSVTVVGIFGIPGVGKTVLAKYVYNQLYHLFDACSFLGAIQAEIDHHGILSVQNNLISDLDKGNAKKFDSSEKALLHIRKNFCTVKVLVLLDDVTNHEQLSALVGELDWLGPGSRVILTSQTQDVLININGAEIFVLEPMKQDEALKLFHRHAFGTDSPYEDYNKLSTDIVAATGRLPLALEVTGSSLFLVKSKKAWRETLTALEVAPHKRVREALEKSYNNLDESAQQIFLDIACFSNGMDERIPHNIWGVDNYFPSTSIQALQARCFVEIGEDKKLLVHEILKKFGQEIVKNENRNEPFKRSWLCDRKDALQLKRRKGTEKVKALRLNFGDGSEGNTIFKYDHLVSIPNSMYLKLDWANNQGSFNVLLPKLRWLSWHTWLKDSYNQSPDSRVHKDWGGWKFSEEVRNEFTIFSHFLF
ncbi:disease resistance protein RUN1-like [Eucalyptus grandis]|uniref:disease resistance protein RUN1-like n=1 Tax=Eucalyptus grandis TaxID=71139 RepID=UPI00192EA049|nr:disease resistance protein RUN1-like [Eucalyptus grandis]